MVGEIKSDWIRTIHEEKYDIRPDKEIRILVDKAQEGCMESRDKVIHANLRLVFLVLKEEVTPPSQIYMDCVSEGNKALMNAVRLYKTDAKATFATYAIKAIRWRIWKAIQVQGSTVKLPQLQIRRRLAAEAEIYDKEGALDILLSGELLPVNPSFSLDAHYDNGEHSDVPPKELAITEETAIGILLSSEAQEIAVRAMDCLNEREHYIIKHRHLVHKSCKKTLDMLAEDIPLTRERIRQIERTGLKKLKKRVLEELYNSDKKF